MDQKVDDLRQRALDTIQTAGSLSDLESARVALLGRRGEITQLLKTLGALQPEQRKVAGAAINGLKAELGTVLDERKQILLDSESSLSSSIDVTRPGMSRPRGGLHPTIQIMYDLNDAFQSLNFDIFDGPEITSELYEFDNMNFPEDHPARESMDTYWLADSNHKYGGERLCIRPHLTGASVRYMQRNEPPFRFVYPGRVYRNEATDPRHERAFFQYEALIVERHFPFTSGQLLIRTILEVVFRRPVNIRMRAGFFPFVEPGFEIDMECLVCGGQGCRVCKHVGWLEIMPGGVPHPNVFRAAGLDPDEWMGFYINVGLDRLVMMRYGIDDVRLFHSADLRFLTQFR
ncbi:MAG: phenylalanine--tRNA ligase subunit alpha [Candidatus Tectomicrobia bacterium]|nr:phenylalanine--tRNA ligase subunit alpha [Candidatus Tectomicrobia bacterium]